MNYNYDKSINDISNLQGYIKDQLPNILYISKFGNSIDIFFSSALDPSEKTILDNLLISYTDTKFLDEILSINLNSDYTNETFYKISQSFMAQSSYLRENELTYIDILFYSPDDIGNFSIKIYNFTEKKTIGLLENINDITNSIMVPITDHPLQESLIEIHLKTSSVNFKIKIINVRLLYYK